MSSPQTPPSRRPVPGFGGPNSDERTPDGQSALRLHARIAVVAVVLCAFVTAIFFYLGTIVPAILFAVVGLASLGALVWAVSRRRRGQREA